jgi:hypothetical protein
MDMKDKWSRARVLEELYNQARRVDLRTITSNFNVLVSHNWTSFTLIKNNRKPKSI